MPTKIFLGKILCTSIFKVIWTAAILASYFWATRVSYVRFNDAILFCIFRPCPWKAKSYSRELFRHEKGKLFSQVENRKNNFDGDYSMSWFELNCRLDVSPFKGYRYYIACPFQYTERRYHAEKDNQFLLHRPIAGLIDAHVFNLQ
jgi:hypothetical protein